METIQESRRIPVWGSYDVVVAGAGVAGLAAALAARRAGKRVLVACGLRKRDTVSEAGRK